MIDKTNENDVKQAAAGFNMIDKNNQNDVKQAAAGLGIKYTDNDLKAKINAAVSIAESTGLLTRAVDESKKKSFDTYVQEMDEQLQCSLENIQKALGGSFRSIFAVTKYKDEEIIPNGKVVDALNMLADIKNALVEKQALNFKASFADTEDENDNAWSDFKFKLGSKEYDVYVKHTENKEICIDVGDDEYHISLKDVELVELVGKGEIEEIEEEEEEGEK